MHRAHLLAYLASTLAVAAGASDALAQPAPCRERERDAEIERANRLRLRERTGEAVGVLEDLWRRCPEARVRVQLALAEQSAGRWYEAWMHLNEVLSEATDPWVMARAEVITRARDTAREHLAALSPTANVPGAELLLNGTLLGALPLAAPHVVTPGTVSLEVRASGHQPHRWSPTLQAGETLREAVALTPIVVAPNGSGSSDDPEVTHDFRFPVGSFWRIPVSTSAAPTGGRQSGGQDHGFSEVAGPRRRRSATGRSGSIQVLAKSAAYCRATLSHE